MDRARELFEQGQVVEAGEMLHRLRQEADAADDERMREEIRDLARELKGRLIGFPGLADFNRALTFGSEGGGGWSTGQFPWAGSGPAWATRSAREEAAEIGHSLLTVVRFLLRPAPLGALSMLFSARSRSTHLTAWS